MVRLQSCIRKTYPLLLISIALGYGEAQAQEPRFLPDDPLVRVPARAVAGPLKEQKIDELYDFAYNSAHYKKPAATPSLGINTLGEVPDSAWYTNRHALHRMTREELQRGARKSGPPVSPFTVVAAKTEGVTPGFRVKDGKGRLFFVKVDPESNPEMATAADVIGALFFYALGYNVPENYILEARREDFHLSPKATISTPNGKKRPMRKKELDNVLDAVPVMKDGRIRLMASLRIDGKLLGPFSYQDTRSDDPNDIVPHQQRRDLRGLAVFCAWLNHTDAKSLNSLDALQGTGSRAQVVHYLIDFGAAFGSDSDIAKDPRHGREFIVPTNGKEMIRKLSTFGVVPAKWETVHYPHNLTAVGNFTSDAFDPLLWKSNYPNPAFEAMLPGDAYWAAKQVMAFTDDDIRVIVEQGKFSDARVVDYITNALIARRDAIGRAWFRYVPPLDNLRIANGQLQFNNLAADHGFVSTASYKYQWFRWNNAQYKKEPITKDASPKLPSEIASADGSYMGCTVVDAALPNLSVTAYFRSHGGEWQLVGIDRKSDPPSLP